MTRATPEVLDLLRLLADETRLRILELVATGERGVDELAEATGVKAPTMSHHLTKLRDAGLVRVRADANRRLHSLAPAAVQQVCQTIASHFGLDEPAESPSVAPALDDFVSPYLRDGQLVELPAERTARLLALDWVARQFDATASYHESEVAKVLAHVAADPTRVRRLLLDYGLLHRVGKIYWLREDLSERPRRRA